ncbi:hypothetical protein [Borrelia hermsii]|uniref:Protein BptA n=2 Tax=Borrelia hermsii TaxID=140 RepID=T1ECD7_BORHE|nr:hypothetical protein [Borrelia hermsii]ADN26377.1 hypothetical protein BHA119 [Borrelia hermsii]AMR75959.1 hypothetical protein A0V01_04930 [Borrelia hermsii]ANA43764.1 hypothetical protein AXX13_A0615 [Borrelia hermsii HS1]UCP01989.1 hypothetical protein K9R62_04960 [Borrelia hermsii]UPA08557.1 hypothetical protein bhDAH_001268 [Borrelia hermsii DAH]
MFIQVIARVLMYFQFYVLGVFLLGAKLESSCESKYFCSKRYSEEFKSGSIRSISFKRGDLSKSYREEIKTMRNEEYRKAIEEGYPAYYLEFEIVSEPRAINFKKVIFDGAEAEVSIFDLYEPSAQLASIKDFQMGEPDVNKRFLNLIFPIPVHNTFTIVLKKRFIDKLKKRDKIKITLTSHYDKEFVFETYNFIKKYGF